MYNNQAIDSVNKMKTTWNIIKTETTKQRDTFLVNTITPQKHSKIFPLSAGKIIQDIKNNLNNIEDPE
jgi:hypothetical protein